MPELVIDQQPVSVPEGTTVLDAAASIGVHIPTLCYREGVAPGTSCYVCVVRVDERDALVPACGTRVREGMRVDASSDDVVAARRMALELLLSDHVGDCIGPCHAICPAHMNIPLMIRQIAAGDLAEAIATVKAHIALPATLGRICQAPCERGCRRGLQDDPLAIMLLKRIVADVDLAQVAPFIPELAPATGKRVGIVGCGPAGLATAYYLRQLGHACVLYDEHDLPGGKLRDGVESDRLPRDVLDAEIATITALGVEVRLGQRIDRARLHELRAEFHALVLAPGSLEPGVNADWDVPLTPKGIQVDSVSLQTPWPGVFCAGDAVRPLRRAVNSVAAGRTVAHSVDRFLGPVPRAPAELTFNSRLGKLQPGELEQFMQEAEPTARVQPAGGDEDGFRVPEAKPEARRCLHCDCRKATDCLLRISADALGAGQRRFHGATRKPFRQLRQHASVVYEPGKCIACGLCVRLTEAQGEDLGLTFVGRGFDVVVGVPFNESLGKALTKTASECVTACPTGALAFRQD